MPAAFCANLFAMARLDRFRPTSGSVGKIGLVTVAVVRDPHHAIPLHGTFIGSSLDHLDMEVQVTITPGTPEAISANPDAPRTHNSANRFDRRRDADKVR